MLIFILIISYLLYKNRESFMNIDIVFLNKNELYKLLIKNEDLYYNTFTDNDLIVRNINNINDYYNLIKYSVVDCDNKNKTKIQNCIYVIDKKFNDIKFNYFDGIKFNNIKWQFGFIKGKLYEGGLPHTRNDTIILPIEYINSVNNDVLIKLLIHEKIHVYQKLYPNDIKKYLITHNFTETNIIVKNKRANPDINNIIYKDINNKLYYTQYNNNPKNISDVTYYPNNSIIYEHPYEQMAYNFENIINY
jgi:hypothetical protein